MTTIKPRTAAELKKIAAGQAPFKGALWFGAKYGWGVKRTAAGVASFTAAKAALAGAR